MTWVEGRKLDTVTIGGQTYTYVYNSDGQRVKKINPDSSYIEYYVMDGTTVGESHFTATGNKTLGIRYTLDESNSVIGFTTGGQNYYFAKNLQGDVLAVYNATTNELAAEYTYDSWGNILTATGSLAEINPFRYRGYYYDEETNFYYLQSRYYNPEIGRFINADAYISTGQGLIGYNMFAYCNNNPINYYDSTGRCLEWIVDFIKQIVTTISRIYAALKEQSRPNRVSDEGAAFIASYEDFKSTVYDDGLGNPTIGYGHLIVKGESFTSITEAEGMELFKEDLEEYENIVSEYMQKNNIYWNQNQYDAMVSVAFNSGPAGFRNIADKLVAGWDAEAAFTWFYTQEKAKLSNGVNLGLWRRRMDECDIFVYGTYEREYRNP